MQLCLKNLKRLKICLHFNAEGCGQAKMSCELDKHSVPLNLQEVGRIFPALSLISLYIYILEM